MMIQGIIMNIITCVIPLISYFTVTVMESSTYIHTLTHMRTHTHTQNHIFTAHDTNISHEYIQTLTMAIVNCIKPIKIECHMFTNNVIYWLPYQAIIYRNAIYIHIILNHTWEVTRSSPTLKNGYHD